MTARPGWRVAACAAFWIICAACGGGGKETAVPIRLVDRYAPEALTGGGATRAERARVEWKFAAGAGPGEASSSPTEGWQAGPGVSGLAVAAGLLTGRTTSDLPVVHVERKEGPWDDDLIHAVEVRMRASAGAEISASFAADEKIEIDKLVARARDFPWMLRAELTPGDEARTYTLRPKRPIAARSARHLLLNVTDAPGSTFAIESVRVIFRKEHLASYPSGVSWQGLAQIYHETLVARSPERMQFSLRLPARPWLDLAIGTVEDGPVTFRVAIAPPGKGTETVVLERTLTHPHRWEPAPIDLAAYAGREVTLALELRAEAPGALGFWGSPAVRERRPAVERTAHGSQPPQGVILILADTLRRDHLEPYGYARPTSPALRALAQEGVLFRDCIAQGSWTKVSAASLLTSLYPSTHGVKELLDRVPASVTTIAEAFRDAGHATLSLSSIQFTGQFSNLHQGFEELHEDGSLPDQESSKTAREYVDRLLPWLEAHRDVPFFVLLHVSDPHDPFKPYPPYDTMWANPAWEEEHAADLEKARKVIAEPLLRTFGMPTGEELRKAGVDPDTYVARDRDWYDGSIRALDAEVARLVERLRALGIAERTLVAFTSDHGEEFLDHGRTFHGQSVYGELGNVPLILWGPGQVPAGAVVAQPVASIDIMPTLLALGGVAVPSGLQGRSLLPLFAGEAADAGGGLRAAAPEAPAGATPLVTEKAATEAGTLGPPPHHTASQSIVLDGWKLIQHLTRDPGKPEFELFDRRTDLLDQRDVAAEHPDVVGRLTTALATWRSEAEAARRASDTAGRELSPEERERLRSLGYVQ